MYKRVKSFFDRIFAATCLIIALPLLLITALVLSISNKGKVFFLQQRPGKNEVPFTLYKFLTMSEARNERGELLSDDLRLTRVGGWVRKSSLDELPQLVNILKGEMSFVGPRPLLMEYLPLYNERQKKRHNVRPGITGWAQVNGRNTVEWTKRFEYDVWYVEHMTFSLDIKILWMTFLRVIRAEGINSPTFVTMEKFTGNG